MTESEPSSPTQIGPILHLLASAGYCHATSDVLSDSDKLLHGVAWCISAAANSADHPPKTDTVEDIEDALKSMECPHALQATQIEDRDYVGIYPAVQWIVSCVKQRDSSYENERKASVLTEMQLLKIRIEEAGIGSKVQSLVSLLKQSKAMERQGTELQSDSNLKCFSLQSEITKLEEDLIKGNGVEDPHGYFDCSISDLSKKLNFAKKELSSVLRELVSLKRQLDELPIDAELVQYERRFSELNVHIQDKLRQTRKYYETYNSLLEIKDLMLKEISLLNSIDSQFGDAIGNPAGRTKLIDSMEAILKGIQQKREKVQLGLQVQQKTLDTLRERYSAVIMNQRHCSVLLKDFQEECRKNERLRKEFALHKEQRGQTSP